jgi:hypothetical protein
MMRKYTITVKSVIFKEISLNRIEITGERLDWICKYNISGIAIES